MQNSPRCVPTLRCAAGDPAHVREARSRGPLLTEPATVYTALKEELKEAPETRISATIWLAG
jgi:hypothetical protein